MRQAKLGIHASNPNISSRPCLAEIGDDMAVTLSCAFGDILTIITGHQDTHELGVTIGDKTQIRLSQFFPASRRLSQSEHHLRGKEGLNALNI